MTVWFCFLQDEFVSSRLYMYTYVRMYIQRVLYASFTTNAKLFKLNYNIFLFCCFFVLFCCILQS